MFYHKSNPHNTCMDWAHEGRKRNVFAFLHFLLHQNALKKVHVMKGLCSISSCCVHLSSVFISLAEHCTQEHLMRLYTYTIFPKVFCHLSSHPYELEWKPILNRQVLICHLPTIYSYDSFNSCWSCWYVTVVKNPGLGHGGTATGPARGGADPNGGRVRAYL